MFVGDLDAPTLDEGDARHLSRVLRVRAGEVVSLSDGIGGWRPAAWVDGGGLAPLSDPLRRPPATPPVTVAMAVPKGDRPEWAVAKLTELGVDRIVPLVTTRSVVRWDAGRSERSLTRWRTVARQAAMQSRRLWLPTIGAPTTPAALAAAVDGGLAMAEPGGAAPSLTRPTVLIGPEGGWADEELALGLPGLGLGPTVLRTETAAVVAGTLLVALRSGVVRPR